MSFKEPGVVRTIEGNAVDLCNFTEDVVNIRDIAWGIGRTIRFGGHIRQDHTVAHHSIVMSYYVPEEYALEALLHDAAEAYIGDIIWPVKALFPEVSQFEDKLLHIIMDKFGVKHATVKFGNEDPGYVKSTVVEVADIELQKHEAFEFGRPGIFVPSVDKAWIEAATAHEEFWYAPQYAFLQRFQELTGGTKELDLDELTYYWFRDEWEANKALREASGKSKEEIMAEIDDMMQEAPVNE